MRKGDEVGKVAYINYEEAQKLLPLFRYLKKKGPWKEVREEARLLIRELELVRPIDYSPMGGRQIFLTDSQYDFLMDAKESLKMD